MNKLYKVIEKAVKNKEIEECTTITIVEENTIVFRQQYYMARLHELIRMLDFKVDDYFKVSNFEYMIFLKGGGD